MRTVETNGGYTVVYPDNFVLSRNRNILTVSGSSFYTKFKLFFEDLGFFSERDLVGGEGFFDLQTYFESYFADELKNAKFLPKSVRISIYTGDYEESTALEFSLYEGRNRPFDIRKLPKEAEYNSLAAWFDFWLPSETTAEVNGVTTVFPAGYNSLDLSGYHADVVLRFENTFDDTFDETFFPGLDPVYIHRLSCPENGVILRWLDRWGVWQQKTFSLLTTIPSGSGSVYNWEGQPNSLLYGGLVYSDKKESVSIDIQAQSCGIEEAHRLSELCSAKRVHAYDGATSTWIPVVVTTQSIPVSAVNISQNISINVILQNEA